MSLNKAHSWKLFNKISGTYDQLNQILSLGIDHYWRNRLVKELPNRPHLEILDLGTGTGEVALSIWKKKASKINRIIGVDPAKDMLAIAKKKTQPMHPITWQVGDAQALSFSDSTFDVVTMAFAIRNVPDPDAALAEIYRVLKPGGRALILEFSLPKLYLIRSLYLLYFRKILPVIGGIVSKNKEAYRYLNESVEIFPYGKNFRNHMGQAGFRQIRWHPLTFGIATLYVGEK